MVSEDTPTNAHVYFHRNHRKQVQIIFSYTIKITFLFIYIIYRLYCCGLFKIYLPLSKKSVESQPSSFLKTSTAEGIHIHIYIYIFSCHQISSTKNRLLPQKACNSLLPLSNKLCCQCLAGSLLLEKKKHKGKNIYI